MTREETGKALGWFVVLLICLVVPYLGVAFVTWQANPGNWLIEGRVAALASAVVMVWGAMGIKNL